MNFTTEQIVLGHEDDRQALQLTGGPTDSQEANFVELSHGVFDGLSEMTISTWARWDGGPDFQWIYGLGKDNDSSVFMTPSFEGVQKSRSSIKPVNGSEEVGVTADSKLPADTWLNLVTVVTGQELIYYINGYRIGSEKAELDIAATLHDDAGETSGFLGKPFWEGHPYFAGAIDEFTVWDIALEEDDVIALSADDRLTIESVEESQVEIELNIGEAIALPATVPAKFSDGSIRAAKVQWDDFDPDLTSRLGTHEIKGYVEGIEDPVTAVVSVTYPNSITADFSQRTGAFHGGASGTLYGVYGEDLPSSNLLEAINLRTVATKAQDGPQHPGADGLEVVKALANSSGGDVYIYMTDIHRGFPYQWPGNSPEEKLDLYMEALADQVAQAQELPKELQDKIVFMPYNEPEGNMFGTGTWSYNGTSWLDDPTDYFAAWDRAYELIKGMMPDVRVGGPNTSLLYTQNKEFLNHTVQAGTVPDVFVWHELSDPATIRTTVDRYRDWEVEVFSGTDYAGTELPINLTEYAHNYHTSVPGQMIQWISAIEEMKVDADIAYWNIDGNLGDSAVQANRGNGQWWLLQSYGQMTGETVFVDPPNRDESYTLQGVATIDDEKAQARFLIGGGSGKSHVSLTGLPGDLFGSRVHVEVSEIPWTGQLGDSAQPETVYSSDVDLVNNAATLWFGEDLPALTESSAYQLIISPSNGNTDSNVSRTLWKENFEAESAAHTGGPYHLNGPEGSPSNIGGFHTSGGMNIGVFGTGSDLALDFEVTAPEDGKYDLSLFTSTLNTSSKVEEQGPTNVFVSVNGGAEQEVFLPLGYKWVVWDHVDIEVDLEAGSNTIRVAAESLDGSKKSIGDAIIDRIEVSLSNPAYEYDSYEAEFATLDNASVVRGLDAHGPGAVELGPDGSVIFWVYSKDDEPATLTPVLLEDGNATIAVNEVPLGSVSDHDVWEVFLKGGINKVELRSADRSIIDRLLVEQSASELVGEAYEAEGAIVAGSAKVSDLSLASGGKAVTAIGGSPGNANTLTFDNVTVTQDGIYALTVRYSNEEQSVATHYNPDPLARYANLTINGQEQRVWFPHSFHENNFWELTIPVELKAGDNTVEFQSEELPNFDGETYISDTWPDTLLRSKYAPNIDSIRVTPYSSQTADSDTPTDPEEPGDGEDQDEPGEPEEPGEGPLEPGQPEEPGDDGNAGSDEEKPASGGDKALPRTGAMVGYIVTAAILLLILGFGLQTGRKLIK